MQANIDELTGSINVLVAKMDSLIQLNRDIIRWLLVVVCVIALGRSAFDVGRELLSHVAQSAHATVQK